MSIADVHQHPFPQPTFKLQQSSPPSPLLTSHDSLMNSGAIRVPFLGQLSNFTNTVPNCGLPMTPLLQLKPLSSIRQVSAGISEISELFKTTSIDQELEGDDSLDTHSHPPVPSRGQDSGIKSLAIASRPIHLRHLSNDRLFSRETFPFFSLVTPLPQGHSYNLEAYLHCPKFPRNHQLNSRFVELYQLEDELGSGGYGFVMTARHRLEEYEVAVKFIVKERVPEHAWMQDELLGQLPTEVVLLNSISHDNIVKFLDLFEDNLYFYLVQELHGTPWQQSEENMRQFDTSIASTPSLSPSASERSLDPAEPATPPSLPIFLGTGEHTSYANREHIHPLPLKCSTLFNFDRPAFSRRSSHDLFECIEQSQDKRLSETHARYVFAQVVDVVDYLDKLGVAHRDIKDENLVIDQNLKVKLIDFGSATSADLMQPRPYYSQFYGTAAYASSEILLKKRYQAAPAEIWTLGVLLSYLLTGTSPFPSVRDAMDGKVVISENSDLNLPDDAVDLIRRCLDPDPETRIRIQHVKAHPWLTGGTR